MSRGRVLEILNQPFVLWFLSSVVIGFVSWQYAEIQKSSAEEKVQKQTLRKANLELNLLLQDIKFGAEQGENINISHLSGILLKMQYNAVHPGNQLYFPSLQNVMLEIDSRSGTDGLEKFQVRVFDHLKIISNSINRIVTPYLPANRPIWSSLTDQEKSNLQSLSLLTEEVGVYYKKAATTK
ncbi:hypothetical protein SIO17_07860 [Pseudoalteromonas piscicida]|uniref:Uncharacterized protein n=1 Tax=Pseudoalteromonas piscicida TaxID=43662 RepID=A0ABN5CBI7_PSEO7|nr:hypothetical protein [Pseudoalteromonas piscicida]ATD06947.1 hypothetical protein PPIS_a1882 [Pseudoalteromonas piscicida]WPU33626.1 hypothetical protein SIO17_07860 [Pseudoalteromonas piscicida]